MSKYESMMVFSVVKGEEVTHGLVESFTKLIGENGEVLSVDEWGKRTLAYEINDEKDGYYVVFTYESKEDFPAEISRKAGITEGVLRIMTTSKNV